MGKRCIDVYVCEISSSNFRRESCEGNSSINSSQSVLPFAVLTSERVD